MNAHQRAHRLFVETYDDEPSLIVRAPGRINLIGDHTDYNGGFVLPMTIDADLVIAARPRSDRTVNAVSESRPESAHFELTALSVEGGWPEYLKGVAAMLDTDRLIGWDGAIASDLPDGAGLSSSAAIELAAAKVFAELSGLTWEPKAMALISQRAENEWVGMNSGIMDQLICATGRAGHARLIDCQELTGTDIALPDDAEVVMLDTGTRRQLLESAYGDRRADCEEAARDLGVEYLSQIALGDLTPASLSPRLHSRARHVVSENLRTQQAATALAAGDSETVGRLMNESHASLRDDFEVSSPALDLMARTAQEVPGCFGARQTGGGFAGSCVALVEAGTTAKFMAQVLERYQQSAESIGTARVCRAVDGVGLSIGDS